MLLNMHVCVGYKHMECTQSQTMPKDTWKPGTLSLQTKQDLRAGEVACESVNVILAATKCSKFSKMQIPGCLLYTHVLLGWGPGCGSRDATAQRLSPTLYSIWLAKMFDLGIFKISATGSMICLNPPETRYTVFPCAWRVATSSLIPERAGHNLVSHMCLYCCETQHSNSTSKFIIRYTPAGKP